jgi:hypothetical protein
MAELPSKDEIPLPVAGHRSISDFRGALADHDRGGNEGFSLAADPGSRHAQRTAGAKAGGQLAPQRTPALHVKSLVNRLVADTHRIICGKIQRQALGNLFRAPRRRPPAVLPAPCSPPLPCHLRPINLYSIGRGDRTCKPLLHITAQNFILR